MKVLSKNVLIEQTLIKKQKNIITLDSKPEDNNVYESSLKILGFGKDVQEEFKVGDIPVITKWAEPAVIKVIKGENGDNEIVRHLIYPCDQIIAIDNSQEI